MRYAFHSLHQMTKQTIDDVSTLISRGRATVSLHFPPSAFHRPSFPSTTTKIQSSPSGVAEDSHGTDKRSGYGWDKLLALARAETLENADSYSYFATMCLLLDRQWKLPDSDDDQKAGKMVQDTSLPLLKGNDVPIYIPPDNAGNTAQSKTQQPPAKAPAVSPVAVASQSRKRASILTCRDPSAMVVEGRCVEFVS